MDRHERQKVIKTIIERFKQKDKFRTKQLRSVLFRLNVDFKTWFYRLQEKNIIEDAGWGYWKITNSAIRDYKQGKFIIKQKSTKEADPEEKRFNSLCRDLIEHFYFDRNTHTFKTKEFRITVGKGRIKPHNELLSKLQSKEVIEKLGVGKWKITKEAVIRYRKGEFND